MAKIIGVGGVFLRARDQEKLRAWYEEHLGLRNGPEGAVLFPWKQADDMEKTRMTVWTIFPDDTAYFGAARPSFMVNYIVNDLDGMLEELRAKGANVNDKREDYDYGRFAWVTDPEGNRIELWEPPK